MTQGAHSEKPASQDSPQSSLRDRVNTLVAICTVNTKSELLDASLPHSAPCTASKAWLDESLQGVNVRISALQLKTPERAKILSNVTNLSEYVKSILEDKRTRSLQTASGNSLDCIRYNSRDKDRSEYADLWCMQSCAERMKEATIQFKRCEVALREFASPTLKTADNADSRESTSSSH